MSNGADNVEQPPLIVRLQAVDRRVIFVAITLAVAIPLLFSIKFPEKITPIVDDIYDKVESLPEGSRVLISFDYSPSTVPEVQPMVDAIVRHSCTKKLKVYCMATWATGQNIADETIDRILTAEFPEYEYGVDYLNLGYKSGNQGLINVILTDMKRMYTTDVNGTGIDDIPIMEPIRNLRSFDVIFSFGGGTPGLKEWILFAGDPGNIPVAGGVTAVQAPLMYPYYPTQMLGMMGGIKGAAEYESELMKNYPRFRGDEFSRPGLEMMGPQAIAHAVILLFIVVGNIAYFASRRHGGQSR